MFEIARVEFVEAMMMHYELISLSFSCLFFRRI